ncbi:Z1 domain-containing protein [Candidatus Binatia bacterium]|nr:Z1 domain-containing protein [Candidatus Binatia bacterium]
MLEDIEIRKLLEIALIQMGEKRGPRDLHKKLGNVADEDDLELSSGEIQALIERALLVGDPNHMPRLELEKWVRRWDGEENGQEDRKGEVWYKETAPHSPKRRDRILELLNLPGHQRSLLGVEQVPIQTPNPFVIIHDLENHHHWYDQERRDESSFYWESYRDYLRDRLGWSDDNVDGIRKASEEIVAHLRDPRVITGELQGGSRKRRLSSRGLVVGYVQSGKTANFTAVVARAIDAGYRIIIVLAGRIEILRKQTVRRLDKELIGKDFHDQWDWFDIYKKSPDWKDFVQYGQRLKEPGVVHIARQSRPSSDFKEWDRDLSPAAVFDGAAPEEIKNQRPLLFVVKKNSTVLKNLTTELGRSRHSLRTVPALVIDDESDDAGVNTKDPSAQSGSEEQERTTTNKLLVKLLKETLPNAQYVGYTATPFANVFTNHRDVDDIYPRDFVLPLPRPRGYMGVRSFYDLTDDNYMVDEADRPQGYESNKRAFYRPVKGADEFPELESALDAFVLAGAIKCFREQASQDELKFRHHTMLVHTEAGKDAHWNGAKEVAKLYRDSRYRERSGKGLARLRKLWEEDFAPVSLDRAKAGLLDYDRKLAHRPDLFPSSFEELAKDCLKSCLDRIDQSADLLKRTIPRWTGDEVEKARAEKVLPAVVENSDRERARLNFDDIPTWSIVCGGTKLARGFTVEGLTVSYFRRKTLQGDTLMQMGRWFGYRPGYGDLVRVYLGVEPHGKRGEIDLYEEFGAVCLDEERFREKLETMYDRFDPNEAADARPQVSRDGKVQRITPLDIPPMVETHSEFLRPTSKNKMYYTERRSRNFGGEWLESGSLPDSRENLDLEAAEDNEALTKKLLQAIAAEERSFNIKWESISKLTDSVKEEDRDVACRLGYVDTDLVLEFLENFRWGKGTNGDDVRKQIHSELIGFLRGGLGDPKIDGWTVMVMGLQKEAEAGNFEFQDIRGVTCQVHAKERARPALPHSPFRVFSEPAHRRIAGYLAGVHQHDVVSKELEEAKRSRNGVLVVYPTKEKKADFDRDFSPASEKDYADIPLSMGHGIYIPPNKLVLHAYSVGDRGRYFSVEEN